MSCNNGYNVGVSQRRHNHLQPHANSTLVEQHCNCTRSQPPSALFLSRCTPRPPFVGLGPPRHATPHTSLAISFLRDACSANVLSDPQSFCCNSLLEMLDSKYSQSDVSVRHTRSEVLCVAPICSGASIVGLLLNRRTAPGRLMASVSAMPM
eukprot:m.1352510 g.1352510  ORF g.1352510 m.1352510 type:complete len:152 (+) comp24925_c2_seq2:1959-2414(+)